MRSPAARASTVPSGPTTLSAAPSATSYRQGDTGRRVRRLQHPASAQVHVDAAGQARVEAADRAHDVDALEVLRRVLLEDRRVLHRVLVRARRAVAVADAAV